MANNILTIDMITNKSLEILENSLVISRNVNRQYDDSFAVEGAKIGTTLRIRLPDRALPTWGAALQVQAENQQYTTLTVAKQIHIGVNFTTAELTMQLDEFADRVLKPRISQIAAAIDQEVATEFYNIGNSVGFPGQTPSTSLVLLQGQQKLDEFATPRGSRYVTVNPAANAGLVEGLKGLLNPVDVISRQFKSGDMGEHVFGYDEVNMSQSIGRFTTGSWPATGTTVSSSVASDGVSQITLAFTGSNAVTVNRGDVFTVAGTYAVNPQTRQRTSSLYQFVALEPVTSSGSPQTATVVVYPIFQASNALATVDVLPAATSAVTFWGSPSTSYAQNLIYHKDAITLATADLIMPRGVDMASRAVHNGISLRVVRQYDINNDRLPCRIDVLFGVSTIRPVTAVRLWGE